MRRLKKTRFAIVGVGYDSSASLGWPGARYAPESIRKSLRWIRNRIQDNKIFDVDGNRLIDMTEIEIKDWGDLPLSRYNHEQTLREIKEGIDTVLAAGWTPIILGGDHSISWPGIQAFHDRVEGPIGIIQLDAHLDLLDESGTQGRYSGSSEIRRALELPRVDGENVVQVGVRGYNYPEHFTFIHDHGITMLTPEIFHTEGIQETACRTLEVAGRQTTGVYLTVDIDVLDSAYAPGSGAHETGGINSFQLLHFVRQVAPFVDVMDVVEVNPLTDQGESTASVAARIVFDFIVAASRPEG